MNIQFCCIGKNHEPYVRSGIDDFTNRISNYFPVRWNIIPAPRNSGVISETEQRRNEGESLLEVLRKEDCLIALDEKGKQFTSIALAQLIQSRANVSVKNLIFLIGGAYGLDESVLKRANYKWSLSALTFPHQLVRLILAEQIYRACSILRNEKYHHP